MVRFVPQTSVGFKTAREEKEIMRREEHEVEQCDVPDSQLGMHYEIIDSFVLIIGSPERFRCGRY